jgi:hypothetical protein
MDSVKYIGMDVHKEAISLAVLNSSGKLVWNARSKPRPSPFSIFSKDCAEART